MRTPFLIAKVFFARSLLLPPKERGFLSPVAAPSRLRALPCKPKHGCLLGIDVVGTVGVAPYSETVHAVVFPCSLSAILWFSAALCSPRTIFSSLFRCSM